MTKSAERQGKTAVIERGCWQVYMILCSDGSLYTGITTDIDRRFSEHGNGQGARYFRARRPLRTVYLERHHSRGSALRREAAIKSLAPLQKRQLLDSEENELWPAGTER